MIRVYEKAVGVLVPLDVVPVSPDAEGTTQPRFAPGIRVLHHSDENSLGLVIGVVVDTVTVLWQKIPKYLLGFAQIAFPVVKRMTPGLIAQELYKVQPMTKPNGLLFYLDYVYGSKEDADDPQ